MKKFLAFLICFQMIFLPVFAEYDFSDEAQAEFDRAQKKLNSNDLMKRSNRKEIKNNQVNDRTNYTPPQVEEGFELLYYESPQQEVLKGNVVKVPEGTMFDVVFDSGINSTSAEKDDRLTVRLLRDFVYNGVLIAPEGSLVYGTTTDAKSAGYAYGNGSIELNFNEIMTPDGNVIKIATEKIYFEEPSQRAAKMTRDVVIGALGSLLVGVVLTGLSGDPNWGRNMAIFGGMGAVGGAARGAMQRGFDINVPDGTTVQLKLIQPLMASPFSNEW